MHHMAFSFGFANDGASDDEDTAPISQQVAPATNNAPEVAAKSHKLEDMVGALSFRLQV
jgi:protein-histidine N-methyltransferase